jgi:thiamine biosynthesis lipoprotein
MTRVHRHRLAIMDTTVTFEVVSRDPQATFDPAPAIDLAIEWFRRVEASCSRFDPASEVSRLAARPGVAVAVSPILMEAVRFALAVASESGGAFDPTIGADLERRGFDREYRSGASIASGIAPDPRVSYRDVEADAARGTIAIARPLLLDLGGVAKGLAVDLAARELQPFGDFAVDAGGDLYLAGHNADDEPWSVGVPNPRDRASLIERLRVSNAAVCTSGDYARRTAEGHHLIDPRTRRPAADAVSVTVVAPSAMVADALGTAAFVLGAIEGRRFLQRQGVEGLIVTPGLECVSTGQLPRDDHRHERSAAAVRGGAALLPHA